VTATVTATVTMDTRGPGWTRVPVTCVYGTPVHCGPLVPLTTDQKVGGSSPSERATLTSRNAASHKSVTLRRSLGDRNRDRN
jgi:hypothetical protein